MARKAYRVKINNQEENIMFNKKKNDEKSINQIEFSIISIIGTLIIGITAIYTMYQSNSNKENNVSKIGPLEINYKSSINTLQLIDATSISDDIGLKKKPYKFVISNKDNYDVYYKIRLVDDYQSISKDNCQNKLLSNSSIKVSVNDKAPFILNNKKDNNYIISENRISKNEKHEYEIRIWIDDMTKEDIINKHYHGKIVVNTVSVNTK